MTTEHLRDELNRWFPSPITSRNWRLLNSRSGTTCLCITKTPLFKYIENFTNKKFSDKKKSNRGGSKEYPQSMFLSRNKENNVYPCKPQFYYIKVGFKGGQNYIGMFSWWEGSTPSSTPWLTGYVKQLKRWAYTILTLNCNLDFETSFPGTIKQTLCIGFALCNIEILRISLKMSLE